MTTLRELADALGLSPTQVSRALDDKPDVSAKTKERVREEARKCGYSPNAAARSMRKQKTDTVAVVLPAGASVTGLGSLVQTLYETAAELAVLGYDLVMIPGLDAAREVEALRRVVDGRRADAVIVVRTRRDDERVAFLTERGVPFVTHGRTARTDHAFVDGDGESGFADATRALAALGHTRIAHIGGPQEYNFAFVRRAGWRGAMTELGLDPRIDRQVHPTETGGFEAVRALFNEPTPPTALLCATDAIAIGAYRAVRATGREPGRDVAIIGHDELPAGALLTPPLSTMRIASSEVGKRLACHLHARLGGGDVTALQTLFSVDLVLRGSHGPASTGQRK